jgi:hypothetical protein
MDGAIEHRAPSRSPPAALGYAEAHQRRGQNSERSIFRREKKVNVQPKASDAEPMELLELMFPSTPQCLAIAAEHRIADLLADGPLSVDELAEKSGTHAPSLHKILQTLCEDRVFAEVKPGIFANTPLSRLLSPTADGTQYSMARLVGAEWLWSCWGRLDHSVSTGKAAFDEVFKMNTWAWLGRNPDQARVFNGAMTDFSEALGPQIAQAYPEFGESGTIADLGGGQGTFLRSILSAYPSIGRGVLADLPPVIEQAKARTELSPLIEEGRLDFAAGDFFEGVPTGIDMYVTKQIMHSWDDDKVVTLLRKCREAAPGARIAAAELVHRDGVSRFVKNFNLIMLVTMAGAIRTAEDFTRVFGKAGYKVTRIVPTNTAFSIVEAIPAD